MFKRRKQPHFMRKLTEAVWPRAGWRRQGTYHWYRLRRMPGSAYSIASGFAVGASMSMTPLMGFHFVLSGLVAWVVRANPVAALIGTIVGNPWTFPFIWVADWEVGNWILGNDPDTMPGFTETFRALWTALMGMDIQMLMQNVWPVWYPMMVGSLPLVAIVFVAVYWPLKSLIGRYQALRMDRMEAGRQRRFPGSKRANESEGS